MNQVFAYLYLQKLLQHSPLVIPKSGGLKGNVNSLKTKYIFHPFTILILAQFQLTAIDSMTIESIYICNKNNIDSIWVKLGIAIWSDYFLNDPIL